MNLRRNTAVRFEDWGSIDYQAAWDRQKAYLKTAVDLKVANRLRPPESQELTPNVLVFCEHPPVYTLGKSGKAAHLLLSESELRENGIAYYPIERGGDITYHGPGQLTGYPIFDLENFATDLGLYLRKLEEAFIRVCQLHYALEAGRIEGLTGVWINPQSEAPRKICALGLKCSRWVTMHGFAFNVNTDLSYFSHIVPCGIADKGVTSLQAELGHPVDMAVVKAQVRDALAEVFGFTWG